MPPTPQILIVDDDQGITALLRDYLARFGLACHIAGDGASMREQLGSRHIDLVVLDLMLPGDDGLVLARSLRQGNNGIPIIMLTARSNPYDRVLGLETGADDYMGKPFEPRELVARIQTVLRRAATGQAGAARHSRCDVVHFDGWALHREDRCVTTPGGLVVSLSNAEFRLLSTFLDMPRRLISRDQLMEKARGRAMDSFERSIDLLVSRLRQKLSDVDASPTSLIKTVRGAGYMFNARSVQGAAGWHV